MTIRTASLVALSLIACGGAKKSGTPNDMGAGPGPTDASSTTPVGAVDGGVSTTLPPLPALVNVQAIEDDDSVSITFDPIDGALDYRVYVFPADGDITTASSGAVTIQNGTYRCAGNRETPSPNVDGTLNNGAWVATEVAANVGGYQRTMDEATLGYVYTQPGPGLVPVYVLGESNANADNSAYFARWEASRTKKYTTSDSERTSLLADRARDDGIAFYVPSAADSTTKQIYVDDQTASQGQRFYFADGAEAQAHTNKTAAFVVLASQATGTQPLMRVYYDNSGGWSHDELVAGQERFNRIYKQGDGLPLWQLTWSGITGPTTLVVEALDTECPYQGHMSPMSIDSVATTFGTSPLIHEPYVTLDQMRAGSATGEVFINGQAGPRWPWNGVVADGGTTEMTASASDITANTGAGLQMPKAIARSFVNVAPKPHAQMDFFADFAPGSTQETFTTIPCGVQGGNCYATWRQQSTTWDQMFINMEYQADNTKGLFAYGQQMGEWWVTYGDVGADTNGKYRLTPKQKATMSDSSYLHVTMEADTYSTDRRYPQIMISDQDIPVQYNLASGHTFIIQTRGEISAWSAWPLDYEFQICNLRTWDVNNQCPVYDLRHVSSVDGGDGALLPGDEVGEHASADHRVTFDVYASSKRAYLFLDGSPYACADMPASGGVPPGPVTVTWGDVLYHSAVDPDFAYHQRHLQIDTRRHFDNLGFSSGVDAPTWDESRFPCVSPISP